MKIPNKITEDSFYFYKGYIIRLYNGGEYALYDTHIVGSLYSTAEQDRLCSCMKKIDKLCKERDDKELQEQELNKFAKLIKPYLDTISNEVLKNVKDLKG